MTFNYLSYANKNLISENRKNFEKNLFKNNKNLKLLENDTDKIIEFNSGYNNEEKIPVRNFWKLIK